jgi:hypothetical protein
MKNPATETAGYLNVRIFFVFARHPFHALRRGVRLVSIGDSPGRNRQEEDIKKRRTRVVVQ